MAGVDTLQRDPATGSNQTEVLAATIASIVERQLSRYAATVNAQIDELRSLIVEQRSQTDAAHASLEDKLASVATMQQAAANNALTDQMQFQAMANMRLDELQQAVATMDSQTSAIVNHVNEATNSLVQRMDEGDQALASAVEERFVHIRGALDNVGPEVQRLAAEQQAVLISKMEYVESSATDRMLTMESRINEQQGTRIAELEAAIGRIGSGFDTSMIAFNQRLLDADNRLAELEPRFADVAERIDAIAAQVSAFDEDAFNAIKDQVSSALGESMLVRIEMERSVGAVSESLDKQAVRMAEIEAQLQDNEDVSAAVQLERLDELERALAVLDPSQFVRRNDPIVAGLGNGPISGSIPAVTPPAPPAPAAAAFDGTPPAAPTQSGMPPLAAPTRTDSPSLSL